MRSVLRPLILFCMAAPAAVLCLWPLRAENGFRPLPPLVEGGTKGPSALLFDAAGRSLYIAEQDENKIAILNPDTLAPIANLPSGGKQPVGLSLSPDGATLAVTNTFSGDLCLLDISKRAIRGRVRLPGMPWGVVLTAKGQAFVSISQRDEVAVVDIDSGKIATRIPVGHRPRAMALTPDGATVLCASTADGVISLIDVATRAVKGQVRLPAINLRAMALSSDGAKLYVTCQKPHNDQPTDNPEAMWTNLLCIVRIENGGGALDRIVTLDRPGQGAADPCGIALNQKGDAACIALSGTHQVIIVPLQNESAPLPDLRRISVGANPRALTVRPHSDQVWIGNHLGNSLCVLDSGESQARFVDLGLPTPSPDRRLRGRFLFSSAHLTRGMRFSCETCHPDGGAEGLSWKFTHVNDGLALRNTRDLRGPLLLTGPYGWSGRSQDFENFVNDEIMGVLKTHKLPHKDVHAFWDLVNETTLPPNPYRMEDGNLTPAAMRGKALFNEKAGCANCHSGDLHGGANTPAWIGTSPQGIKIDVPHLIGVYDSAPYLHDGRAATLEEIFSKYDPEHRHGGAHLLAPAQFQDLLEYVREL